MSFQAQELAFDLAQLIKENGCPVTVRNVTTLSGPVPAPNPPSVAGLVVSGAVSVGAASVSLRATRATGRLVTGDVLKFGADPQGHTVTAPVIAASNGFTAVPIAPPLAVAVTDGESVAATYSADTVLTGFVTSYPARQVNGTSIQTGDIKVRLLGSAVTTALAVTDKVFVGANSYSIVDIHTMDCQGVTYGIVLQARGGVV
jgi:hypothetical protein